MPEEAFPRKRVWNGITPVRFYPMLDITSFIFSEEAFLPRFIREVDNQEPRNDSDKLRD